MRLIFLYTADGQAATGTMPKWDINAAANNHYARQLPEEGYFCMLRELVKRGIIDECMIVVESTHGTGTIEFEKGLYCHVMPEINYLDALLRPDDVIWCRHGFRSWFLFLNRCRDAGRWMLFYGANGGRERWRVWDVIFNDLQGKDYIDPWGRVNLDFRKPTNHTIFFCNPLEEQKFDVMIGASHIHDKKGQWKVINALIEYKRLYGSCPRCVLPGRPYRGDKTNLMYSLISQNSMNVTKTGMLPRRSLADIMRQTKIFVHMGSGQGDRGALEAGLCGCYLVIGQPQYHHPAMTKEFKYCWAEESGNDSEQLAIGIHTLLESIQDLSPAQKASISGYYRHQFGADSFLLSKMNNLFYFIKGHKPDEKAMLTDG
jgi:hypothetical protein